jgi:hypothetical protein
VFKSNSHRYEHKQIPRDKYSIRVSHIHNGNDPDGNKRFLFCAVGKRPAKYMTICRILRRSDGQEMALGIAICSNRDAPNRDAGHRIAMGRAVKDFMMNYGGSEIEDEGDTPPTLPPRMRHLQIVG